MENWVDVPGFEGYYQVSDEQRVRSLDRIEASSGVARKRRGKYKSIEIKKYKRVTLCKEGECKHYLLHRLVWEAFNGPIPEGMEVNHIDENPLNCCLSNLSLMSHKENINWGTRTERMVKTQTNHPKKSKAVEQYDLEGNFIKKYPSCIEVKRQTGFENTFVGACCLGKCKQAYGYVWKYVE